jgi:hypothetical protein
MNAFVNEIMAVQEAPNEEEFKQALGALVRAQWETMKAVRLGVWQRMFHRHAKKWGGELSIKQYVMKHQEEIGVDFMANANGALFVVPSGAWQTALDGNKRMVDMTTPAGKFADYGKANGNLEILYFGGRLSG